MSTAGATGPAPAGNVTAALTAHVTTPKFIPPNFERMPPELKQRNSWVLWAAIWNGSKWTKRPIQPSGYGASTTKPKHWSSFDAVKRAYERAVQCGYVEVREKNKPPRRAPVGGVGFVFDGKPDENGLVFAGVDFDSGAFKGGVASFAQERIKRLGSYLEASVSGTGLHVIVKAHPLASGTAHSGIELYTCGRFFTMTGRTPATERSIIAAPQEFAALADELRTQACKPASEPFEAGQTETSASIPNWIINSKPSARFAALPKESLAEGLRANIEEIRSAVSAIPASAIVDEPEWMKLARGLAHEAALHPEQAEQLWGILDEASRRDVPGYDEPDNRSRWERYKQEAVTRSGPITIATVLHLARQHGWKGWSPPIDLDASASHPADPGTVPLGTSGPSGAIAASPVPVNSVRAALISALPLIPPKRQWLHGTDLVRGAVSMIVAPGGRAKSTWLIACALACASGRPLLGAHVFGGPLGVLYLSTEDALAEVALRLRAAMQHYTLTDADVPGLNVIGADRWGLPLLHAIGNSPHIHQQGWSALIRELDQAKPDVLIVDPLINAMGGVSTNENSAAALLMSKLAELAATRKMSVVLAHHASKGRDPTSAESAMGAATFTNLARIALGIEPLDEKAAGKIGLPPWEAKYVFRLVSTKHNLSPPDARDRWFRLASVGIANAQPPVYPKGDDVAVVEPFQPGTSAPKFPPDIIRDALLAVDAADPLLSPSKNSRSRYAAPAIAVAIAPHRGGRQDEIEGKAVLDHLLDTALVKVDEVTVPRPGGRSDKRQGLVLTPAGKLAIEFPQSPQSPAGTLQENAGGEPPGSPATPGGCGGNAGARGSGDERNPGAGIGQTAEDVGDRAAAPVPAPAASGPLSGQDTALLFANPDAKRF